MTAPQAMAKAVAEYQELYHLRQIKSVGPGVFPYHQIFGDVWILPGCYAFYDASENLLYIGKSPRGLGRRINDYKRYRRRHSDGPKHKDEWKMLIKKMQLFPVANWWEAASLEDFLIGRFQPTHCAHKGPKSHAK